MIPTEELAAMRTDAEAVLADDVVILRRTGTGDGSGGQTVTYVPVGTTRGTLGLRDLTPREREVAAKLRVSVLYDVAVPQGTDVRPNDRLQLLGRTFEAIALASGSRAATATVVAMEILT